MYKLQFSAHQLNDDPLAAMAIETTLTTSGQQNDIQGEQSSKHQDSTGKNKLENAEGEKERKDKR